MANQSSAQYGIDLEEELSRILQQEIDREIRFELKKAEVEDNWKCGLFSFLFEKEHDFVSKVPINGQCILRDDILMWLQCNLDGRFILWTEPHFVDLYFDGDKEAATLFKLFWL